MKYDTPPTPFLSLFSNTTDNNFEVVVVLEEILVYLCPERAERGGKEKEKEKEKEKQNENEKENEKERENEKEKEVAERLDEVVVRVGGAILVGSLDKPWLSKFSGFCLLDPVYPPSVRGVEGFLLLFFVVVFVVVVIDSFFERKRKTLFLTLRFTEAVKVEGLTNVLQRMNDYDLLDHVSHLFSLPYAESATLAQFQVL